MMQSGPGNSRYGRVNNDSFRRRVVFRLALEQLWCKRVPPTAGFDKLPGKSQTSKSPKASHQKKNKPQVTKSSETRSIATSRTRILCRVLNYAELIG